MRVCVFLYKPLFKYAHQKIHKQTDIHKWIQHTQTLTILREKEVSAEQKSFDTQLCQSETRCAFMELDITHPPKVYLQHARHTV